MNQVGLQGLALPHLNKTNHRDFRTYYTESSAELIAEYYKEDIEFLGYQFDSKWISSVRGWRVSPNLNDQNFKQGQIPKNKQIPMSRTRIWKIQSLPAIDFAGKYI